MSLKVSGEEERESVRGFSKKSKSTFSQGSRWSGDQRKKMYTRGL